MRAARNAAEAKMQTKNKTRRGGSKSSRRAAYLMNKKDPAKKFGAKQVPKIHPRGKLQVCAAGPNLPLTRGLLFNKDKKVCGR